MKITKISPYELQNNMYKGRHELHGLWKRTKLVLRSRYWNYDLLIHPLYVFCPDNQKKKIKEELQKSGQYFADFRVIWKTEIIHRTNLNELCKLEKMPFRANLNPYYDYCVMYTHLYRFQCILHKFHFSIRTRICACVLFHKIKNSADAAQKLYEHLLANCLLCMRTWMCCCIVTIV